MIKDILKDSILYFFSKVLVAALNLYVIYEILHYYGNDIYAKYSITLLIALTVSNFTSTWLSQSFLRKYDENKIDECSFIAISFVLITIVSFLIIIIYGLFNDFGNIYITFLLSVSQSIYSLGRVYLQKKRMIKSYFIYDTLRMIVILIIVKIGIVLEANVIVISYIFGNILFLIPVFNLLKYFNISFHEYKNLYYQWFNFGFPVGIWLTIASGQLLIDRELINYFYGYSASGTYSYYYDLIIKSFSLMIIPLANAIYPIMVSREKDIQNYKKISFNMCFISFIIATITSVVFYYVYPILMMFFEIHYTRFNLSLLVYGILLWQLGLIYQKPLEMMNKTKNMVVNLFVCLLLSTVINVFFGFYFSAEYFSITVAISATVYLFITYFMSVKLGSR